jgi:N-acyl-D-amino-acid deacylase
MDASWTRTPEMRAQFDEDLDTRDAIVRILATNWTQMFPLGDPPDYEPAAEQSVYAIATRENRRPEEVAYDALLEGNGTQFLFAPLANYLDCDYDVIREMLMHPRTVAG